MQKEYKEDIKLKRVVNFPIQCFILPYILHPCEMLFLEGICKHKEHRNFMVVYYVGITSYL